MIQKILIGITAAALTVAAGEFLLSRDLTPKASTELSFFVVQPVGDSVPAFAASQIAPAAEGAGATALIECRSLPLNVCKVTNLAGSSGTVGSLPWNLTNCVTNATFDLVVFDTAGTAPTQPGSARFNQVDNKQCVYVAGQTAKGGLQLIGGTGKGPVTGAGSSHPNGGAENAVWRYTHARCVILDNETNHCIGWQGHRFGSDSTTDTMMDHMSVTGGNDEMVSMSDIGTGLAVRGTLSYNLFHGVALHHPSAGIVGYGAYPTCGGSGTSIFMNYYSTTNHRQPQNVASAPACAEEVNNLIYNQASRNTVSSDSTHTDWVANYIEQVATASGNRDQSVIVRVQLTEPDGPTDCIPAEADTLGADVGLGASGVGTPSDECIKFFVEKNLWTLNGGVDIDTTVDQWFTVCDGGRARESRSKRCGQDNSPPLSQASDPSYPGTGVDSTYYRSYVALFGSPPFPYTRVQAALVPGLMLGPGPFITANMNIGANAWLACDGVTWTRYTAPPDSVAATDFFNKVNRSYSNDFLDYMGGSIPVFTAAGPRCADSDGDGLPDAYELLCTGSTTAMVFDADESGNGYRNMEEYVNGTGSAGRTLVWMDNSSNEDGFRIERDIGSGFVTLVTVGVDVETYIDLTALPGHDYRVIAFNAAGDASPSNTGTAVCR